MALTLRGDPKLVLMVEAELDERGQRGSPVEALKQRYICNPMLACDAGWGFNADLFRLYWFLSSH